MPWPGHREGHGLRIEGGLGLRWLPDFPWRLQADHVDPGKLAGLCGRTGGWNTVSRWSALLYCLLPGPGRSQIQLLQPSSGECLTPQLAARAF